MTLTRLVVILFLFSGCGSETIFTQGPPGVAGATGATGPTGSDGHSFIVVRKKLPRDRDCWVSKFFLDVDDSQSLTDDDVFESFTIECENSPES